LEKFTCDKFIPDNEAFVKSKFEKFTFGPAIQTVLDNLMINFDLTPKQIQRSYEMHRDQKKLKKILDAK
jgi:hypothetical protein